MFQNVSCICNTDAIVVWQHGSEEYTEGGVVQAYQNKTEDGIGEHVDIQNHEEYISEERVIPFPCSTHILNHMEGSKH